MRVRLLGCLLRFEDGHGQVVVPFAVAKERVAESSLDGETASGVGGDGAAVVGEDGETDPVQVEVLEPPGEREADRFSAEALSEASRIENAYAEGC